MGQNFVTIYNLKPVGCVLLVNLPGAVCVKSPVRRDPVCGIDTNWKQRRLTKDPMRTWSGVALPGHDVVRSGEMQWLTRMEANRSAVRVAAFTAQMQYVEIGA